MEKYMEKHIELTELRKEAMHLKDLYSDERLLGIVRRYKKLIDADGIENRMYMEATQDMLEALEKNETTVESLYDDIDIIFRKYHKALDDYRKEGIDWKEESDIRVFITMPIDMLLILFIINHPEYNSEVHLWDFDKQLEPFINALEDE